VRSLQVNLSLRDLVTYAPRCKVSTTAPVVQPGLVIGG
jgi:hypothetical protein